MSENLVLEEILSELRKAVQSASGLVFYRAILHDPVVAGMIELLDLIVQDKSQSWPHSRKIAEAYATFFSALSVKASCNEELPVGNPWQNHLLDLVLSDENAFSQQFTTGRTKTVGRSVIQQVEEDLRKLGVLHLLSSRQIQSVLEQLIPENSWVGWDQLECLPSSTPLAPSTGRRLLKQHLHLTANWESCVDRLAEFYSTDGVGVFSQFRAFHWKPGVSAGVLEGIESVDPIRLDDLVGCDDQKDWLVRNTTHFLAGFRANNVFLYGDRGTGKSSAIKALLHHFADRPFRMLEISRENLSDLPQVMKILRSRHEYFVVFIDDLSFEEGETQYKTLKAVLEGGLETRPANVLIYATSNRRHLIREYFSDRETSGNGEVRHLDTLQEKVSLADRFGIQLVFVAPDQAQYLAIVASIAQRRGVQIPTDELNEKALQWAQLHNGRSGRTARQFVDFLAAELRLSQTAG